MSKLTEDFMAEFTAKPTNMNIFFKSIEDKINQVDSLLSQAGVRKHFVFNYNGGDTRGRLCFYHETLENPATISIYYDAHFDDPDNSSLEKFTEETMTGMLAFMAYTLDKYLNDQEKEFLAPYIAQKSEPAPAP